MLDILSIIYQLLSTIYLHLIIYLSYRYQFYFYIVTTYFNRKQKRINFDRVFYYRIYKSIHGNELSVPVIRIDTEIFMTFSAIFYIHVPFYI